MVAEALFTLLPVEQTRFAAELSVLQLREVKCHPTGPCSSRNDTATRQMQPWVVEDEYFIVGNPVPCLVLGPGTISVMA